jgi:hypothetical protein
MILRGADMNVKELKEKLSKLDDNTKVVVYWEEDKESHFFGIDHVSLTRGTPQRHEDGKPGFTFDSKGPAAWAFISISPE